MSYKVVQTVSPLTGVSSSSASSSNPISLKSGLIRISTSSANANVAIGTSPTATASDFHVVTAQPEVLKERVARQQIAGITTGTSTVVTFGQNYGNPFMVGDYVSVEGVTNAGINTSHVPVTAVTDGSITITHDSSSVVGVITVTNSVVARSVRVSALGQGGTASVYISEVQISSQA